jgi:hypothetical protein
MWIALGFPVRLAETRGTLTHVCVRFAATRMIGGMAFDRWCENLSRANRLSRSFAALRAARHGHAGMGRPRATHSQGPAGLVENAAERLRKKPRNNPMQSRLRTPRARSRPPSEGNSAE